MFMKGYGIMSTLHDIFEYVRSGETEKERLGLEIEHFIVNEVGVQITFEEVTPLIEKVGRETGAKLAVELEPLVNFFSAEEYHQKYLVKNPGGYCHIPRSMFNLKK